MTTNSEATSKISDDHRRSVEINSIGDRETLYTLLRRFVSGVTSPDAAASPPPPLFRRIRTSFLETAPKLPDASRNSAHDLLIWTRRGSPLRSLLVISVSQSKSKRCIFFRIMFFAFDNFMLILGKKF